MEIDILECLDKRILFRFKNRNEETKGKNRLDHDRVRHFSLNKKCALIGTRWYVIDDLDVLDILEPRQRQESEEPIDDSDEELELVEDVGEYDEDEVIERDLRSLRTRPSQPGNSEPEKKGIELTEDHVGKRIIFAELGRRRGINEGLIVEFSNSKNYVKINDDWLDLNFYSILDIVEDKKKEKLVKTEKMKFINDNKE